jgi:hypothetical protein
MKVVALISWIVTALAGATLFGIWVARGGLREQGEAASRFPRPLILGHPILAATGLIIWIIYLASDTDVLRWVAFAILLVVAALGFTMARLWRQERAAVEPRRPAGHGPLARAALPGGPDRGARVVGAHHPGLGPAHRPRNRRLVEPGLVKAHDAPAISAQAVAADG